MAVVGYYKKGKEYFELEAKKGNFFTINGETLHSRDVKKQYKEVTQDEFEKAKQKEADGASKVLPGGSDANQKGKGGRAPKPGVPSNSNPDAGTSKDGK